VYYEEGGDYYLDETWLYEWDSEDRLVKVVQKNGGGTVQKTVEYAYCPACGGNRTHNIVKSSTGAVTSWLRYETEGLNQLRVDERWDSNAIGTITDADDWRTERISYNGPGQIQQMLKETVYTYPSNATNVRTNTTDIYYNYDRMGVVAGLSQSNGTELQQFESDAFGSWDGNATYTTRRITGKEYDEDVDLYYFHARWYEYELAAFTSADPLRAPMLAGPDLCTRRSRGPRFTRTIALYFATPRQFCASSPSSFVDPTGLKTVIDTNWWPNEFIPNFLKTKHCTDAQKGDIWWASIKIWMNLPKITDLKLRCCLRDRFMNASIICGGLQCGDEDHGYRKWPYNNIHLCPLVFDVDERTWSVQYTIVHEWTHSCGKEADATHSAEDEMFPWEEMDNPDVEPPLPPRPKLPPPPSRPGEHGDE